MDRVRETTNHKGDTMRIETYGMVDTETKAKSPAQASLAVLEITDVEASRAHGEHVATLNVSRADGRTARFFVSVFVDSSGRAWAEVAANRSNDEVRRKVAGVWLDYDERARSVSPTWAAEVQS